MDDHKHSTKRIHSQGDKTCFAIAARILDGYSMHISKGLLRMGEAHPLVFPQVRDGFSWVELDVHPTIMHIACILSSATGNGGYSALSNV